MDRPEWMMNHPNLGFPVVMAKVNCTKLYPGNISLATQTCDVTTCEQVAFLRSNHSIDLCDGPLPVTEYYGLESVVPAVCEATCGKCSSPDNTTIVVKRLRTSDGHLLHYSEGGNTEGDGWTPQATPPRRTPSATVTRTLLA